MTILIRPKSSYTRKRRAGNGEEILKKLEDFLKNNTAEPIRILCRFWQDQQNAITYQELREAVVNGKLNENTFMEWSRDYSFLLNNKFKDVVATAIEAGSYSQPIIQTLSGYKFNSETPGILNWIQQRGSQLVTNCANEQKEAINLLLSKVVIDNNSTEEIARYIRPCIGLTKGQAQANLKYYNNIVNTLKEEHPKMKPESIQTKAREAATKYAERQHRQRALTIAQTEMATAYNKGADESIRQAQAQHLIGTVKKRWSTSGDDAVCTRCGSLEGVEIDMYSKFAINARSTGEGLTPPAHPRCACAIEYIEVDKIPRDNVTITDNNSLKIYSDDEIKNIAKQTENIVEKYIDIESKWSGVILISDEGIETPGGIVEYGKLWDCNIITKHETAPGIIMHEQIHAMSASYFDDLTYSENCHIEEYCVQYMTQEISKLEGIEIIESQYDDGIEILRKLKERLGYTSDCEFAKDLIKVPLNIRMNWISDRLFDIMRLDENATIQDYAKYSEMINCLKDGEGLEW